MDLEQKIKDMELKITELERKIEDIQGDVDSLRSDEDIVGGVVLSGCNNVIRNYISNEGNGGVK